jgi:hypothetical protein
MKNPEQKEKFRQACRKFDRLFSAFLTQAYILESHSDRNCKEISESFGKLPSG